MAKPCGHPEPVRTCHLCYMYATDERYRRLWDGTAYEPLRTTAKHPLPCVHLGKLVRKAGCPCPRRDTRLCDAGHGEVSQAGECEACGDYEADQPEPGRRHLVYHLLPVAGNGVWRRGVDQLRLRWGLFTGRKIVAVAAGAGRGFDPPAAVRDYLPADAEMTQVANNPTLREVASWHPLWEAVLEGAADSDAILYAHAKGVTRPVDPGNSCHWWAALLYALCLDHWPLVDRQLAEFPVTGAFKKVGHGFQGSASRWHYSGGFFWVRAGDFRQRPWRRIDRLWWGSEAWLGTAYAPEEAGYLFMEGAVPGLDVYEPRRWQSVYRPEYAKWLTRNPPAWPWNTAPIPSAGSP